MLEISRKTYNEKTTVCVVTVFYCTTFGDDAINFEIEFMIFLCSIDDNSKKMLYTMRTKTV